MTKQIEAIFERGVLHPVKPIDVPEGERVQLIVITRRDTHHDGNATASLAEIAALPIEGQSDAFSGRDHDTVLY